MMLDWIGRTLSLVLSGLATFAVIFALMATPNRTPMAPPPATLETGPATPQALPSPGATGTNVITIEQAYVPTEQSLARIAHWLESLTWAVLALAGFAAAGLIALLRIGAALARIAER